MTETLARPAPYAPLRTRDFALFDAHLHIVDPRFPLVANRGFVPARFDIDDYALRVAGYRLVGGAIVRKRSGFGRTRGAPCALAADRIPTEG